MSKFTISHSGGLLAVLVLLLGTGFVQSAHAALIPWSGTDSSTWTDGGNWAGTPPANDLTTDTAEFDLTTYPNQPNAGTTSVNGIQIGDGTTATAALTLTTTALSLGSGGITDEAAAGAAGITGGTVYLGASQNWANSSSNTLTVGSAISNIGNTSPYTLTISGNTTLNGAISDGGSTGTAALTKTGAGTLTLGHANTFTGGLSINGGTVSAANDGELGGATNAITFNGGTLSQSSAFTIAQPITMTGAGTINNPNQYSYSSITLSGNITGAGGLKINSGYEQIGSATFSGANSGYSGTITFDDLQGSAGGLTFKGANSTGTGAVNFNESYRTESVKFLSDTSAAFGMSNLEASDNTINIDADPITSATGQTITLNEINNYYGNTYNFTSSNGYTVAVTNAGSNQINQGTTFHPTTANLALGTYTGTGYQNYNLTFSGSATANTIGSINGITGGSPVAFGGGAWTLTGSSNYSVNTSISAGTVIVNGSLTSAANAVSISAGTLAGIGSIKGSVTVGNGSGTADSILAPGDAIGTLTTGAVTFNTDGAFTVVIDSNNTTNDELVVNGNAILGSGTAALNLSDIGSSTLASGTILTILNDVGGTTTGFFEGYAQGTQFTLGANTFDISYTGGTSHNDVTLTAAVPEPASLAMLAVGALFMLPRRRRA
ncbi:MAG TPA: autotransporter-associated beta strand repeat-containing protein [Tepidisphaeraceae bacterium]|jgi:autotransporter-associated beta strand protein|nr:autotransporter-associated beta strand repeat-containing protein [Tepidisphaeraceae bacterium]